jgi:PAS domain S-box-containing protein
MNQQSVRLTQMMEISNYGHILYIYDSIENYIENTITFIVTGIEQKNHLLIIDNFENYKRINHRLQELLSDEDRECIHYVDNFEFYRLYGDFHCESIVNHFSKIIKPFKNQQISIRTWANVEWKEQDDMLSKLEHFENMADHAVNDSEIVSVCSYNGNQISARLQNKMLENHEYFMTDTELMKSNLYKKKEVISPFKFGQDVNRRIEGELKATRHQLQSFIIQNLDPILIFDKEDKLVTINKAFERTFGWSSDEVLGLVANTVPIVPEDRLFEVTRNRCFTVIGKDIEGYETVRITKDGIYLDVMLSGFSLLDKEDQFNGWAVIIRDITDNKRAQDLLIKTEKLSIAGELAAGIAHEIRNPITSVKGFLQLLQSGDFENKQDYYNIITSEIDRIELILTELLMLSKPQAIHFEIKNIQNLIVDVMTLLDGQANMNNVQIKTQFELDMVMVRCEENQLKQVWINIIKNAIEAMPKGGELLIKTQSIDDNLVISFIDQGIGIPDAIISKLGQPFYTTKEKGTGLGYMVSKKIIENHNGSITISSEENKGTIIEVSLPKHRDGSVFPS